MPGEDEGFGFVLSAGLGHILALTGRGCQRTQVGVLPDARLDEQGVFLRDLDWVEDEVGADYGLRKLSNYLRDPGLSLAQALSVYNEVFLGV